MKRSFWQGLIASLVLLISSPPWLTAQPFMALATDASALTVTNGPVLFRINSTPSISLGAAGTISVFAGTDLILTANATDGVGLITKISFLKSDQPFLTLTNDPPTPNWTGATAVWTNLAPGSHAFSATATDDAGTTVTSLVENVVAFLPFAITNDLQSRTFSLGSNDSLVVGVDHPENLSFQWFKNKSLIATGVDNSLPFPLVRASDAGSYQVRIHSPLQKMTSQLVRVEVVNSNATSVPLDLKGWNVNVVVGADGSGARRTYFDTSYAAWFEAGWNGHWDGLPQSRWLTSYLNPNTIFRFEPYETNNCLLLTLGGSPTNGTLTLVNPASFSRLSFLAASGYGPAFGTVVLGFDDGSTSPPIAFAAPDWLQPYPLLAAGGFGRVRPDAATNSYDGNWWGFGLFETDLDLDALGLSGRRLASLSVTRVSSPVGFTRGTTIGIMAVSGIAHSSGAPLLSPPQPAVTMAGGAACFDTTATGQGPLTYQWRHDGVALADSSRIKGTKSPQLTVFEAQPTDAGEYYIVVSNALGVTPSPPARLTVLGDTAVAGMLQWAFGAGDSPLGTPALSLPACGFDGAAYVASSDGMLYAVNADGSLRWYVPIEARPAGTPAVAPDGTIYVSTLNASGHPGATFAINPQGLVHVVSTNAVSQFAVQRDGEVFIEPVSGGVAALDPAGTTLWTSRLPTPNNAAIAIGADANAYICSSAASGANVAQALMAFGADSAVHWTVSAEGPWAPFTAIGPDGLFYCWTSADGGGLLAYSAAGDLIVQDPAPASIAKGPTIASDGTVYLASTGIPPRLNALKPGTGTNWYANLTSNPTSPPTVGADGNLYQAQSTEITAFDKDGQALWNIQHARGPTSPILDPHARLLVCASTNLLCIQASSGPDLGGWPMLMHDPQRSGRADGCRLQWDPLVPNQLLIDGELGSVWRIESQDILGSGNWQPRAVVPITTSPQPWTVPDGDRGSVRFYRAVLVP